VSKSTKTSGKVIIRLINLIGAVVKVRWNNENYGEFELKMTEILIKAIVKINRMNRIMRNIVKMTRMIALLIVI